MEDSGNIVLIRNSVNHGPSSIWASVDPAYDLEIGNDAESGNSVFWPISSAASMPDGRIVIVDGSSREIRFFDSMGGHLKTVGGRGSGPGEFRSAPTIRVFSDTILAYDRLGMRLTWFDSAGAVIRDQHIGEGRVLLGTISRLHPSGLVVVQQGGSRLAGETRHGIQSQRLNLLMVSPRSGATHVLDSLPAQSSVIVGEVSVLNIFEATIGPGNWALRGDPPALIVADDPLGSWALSEYDLGGNLVRRVTADVPRRPVTRRLAQGGKSWLSSLHAPHLSPSELQSLEVALGNLEIPDSTSAIRGLLVDTQDRTWVRRWSGYWEAEGKDQYDIIDQSGAWLGVVEVPRHLGWITFVGENHLLMVWLDAYGAPRLRKHSLSHSSA